jgi:hypothetical protein
MGYRSDVYIKTTKEGYKALRKNVKELNEEGYKLFIHPDKLLWNKTNIIMEWDNIKWYDWFPDVKAIEDAVTGLDNHPVHFIRICEEVNDVEDWFYYNNDVNFEPLELVRTVRIYGDEITEEELLDE